MNTAPKLRQRRLATNAEQKLFDRLDKLYPRIADGRNCAVCQSLWKCGVPATEVHHIIPRVHRILRFHPLNLLPLCHKHHQLITDKKLTEPITDKHREWLENMARKDFKGYLIAKGLTPYEYYKQMEQALKETIL